MNDISSTKIRGIDDGSSDEKVELNKPESNKFGKIKFDENGYVISE